MGKYTPLARLGDGGMADVFLAVARGPAGFNKLAVIKRLRNAEDLSHVQMFLDEARLSARLNHPNIVQTYEVGETHGKFFMAMEYLEGQSLHALLAWLARRSEGLGDTIAAFVAEQILRGLHYAHELADYDGTPLGIVHRDVSPQNVFITYRGEIKLLDFGIAKAAVNMTQTETGVLKGKIRYMAPEQVAEKSFDRRVDVFALGIVLWEMLTRRRLFEGDSISVLNKIHRDDAPSVRAFRPAVSAELEAIVAKALKRDPAERYPTAEAMRADLEQYLKSTVDAQTDTALARMLSEAFASTREQVRARINSFLAMLPSLTDTPSASSLARSADDLPVLLGEASNPNRATGSGSGSGSSLSPMPTAVPSVLPSGRRWVVPLVGTGLVIAVAAIAGLSLRSKATPAPIAAPEAPAAAHVQIGTTPAGALVEWEGKPLGKTPMEFVLPAGHQSLTLSLEGYETETIVLDVAAGGSIDRALGLRAKLPPPGSSAAPVPTEPPVNTHQDSHGGRTRHAGPAAASPPPAAPGAPASAPSASSSKPKIKVLDDNEPAPQ
jgi:serine/threonine-protein kinase